MEPCVICPRTAHTQLASLQQELFLSQSLFLKPRLHRLMMQVELDFLESHLQLPVVVALSLPDSHPRHL